MKILNKRVMSLAVALTVLLCVTGCDDASIASSNLRTAADNFEIDRRIVFYNGVTNQYILVIEGLCSTSSNGGRLAVTCKTGRDKYKMHYLGLSDNVTYFSEQLENVKTDVFHYRVIFKPESIVPNIDLNTSVGIGDV
jgi:hypothetical protein